MAKRPKFTGRKPGRWCDATWTVGEFDIHVVPWFSYGSNGEAWLNVNLRNKAHQYGYGSFFLRWNGARFARCTDLLRAEEYCPGLTSWAERRMREVYSRA